MRAVCGGRGCGGPTRSLTARDGTRARGGADRGWLDPVLAELAPTWRLRGCHAGRREVDDDTGRNGRRTTAASGGANHGDTGESEHTGWLHETRGDEPTARIRRRKLDGSESRRRQPAAGEGGNGDEVTRGQFPVVRASTRLRESDASVGLGGATPSEAGDEWVLRSSSGDGGEHTAGDGNGRGGAG
ncbi:pstein-Barr virus EBNA-1-like protein [Oryza sativa Japonica Group]|uniref:Pstein-Barr virus EBNA-1-like protein n=1 Tax=Oryza sativa subsp. japonica TaxID=39947 RepID=Q5JNR4_ORYSJ|nr:pstein-Barr virus EBNA-1-like protein [Oryza sativa Japonica Group]